jgi:hypothetical protein
MAHRRQVIEIAGANILWKSVNGGKEFSNRSIDIGRQVTNLPYKRSKRMDPSFVRTVKRGPPALSLPRSS